MKQTILLLVTIFFATLASAQDARPKDINVSEVDDFKNLSFDVLGNADTLKSSMTAIDNEIKTYSGVMNTMSLEKLWANYKAISGALASSTDLYAQIGQLIPQGSQVLETAKSIQPKPKSVPAVTSTNKSIKALNDSKASLDTVKDLMASNLTILKEELSSRGEIVE